MSMKSTRFQNVSKFQENIDT